MTFRPEGAGNAHAVGSKVWAGEFPRVNPGLSYLGPSGRMIDAKHLLRLLCSIPALLLSLCGLRQMEDGPGSKIICEHAEVG
jgi:hypothetical protein